MTAKADTPGSEKSDSLVSEAGFFQDLAETIRQALYVTEVPSRRLSYVNPAFIRLFGVTLDEMNTEPGYWRHFVHPDDLP